MRKSVEDSSEKVSGGFLAMRKSVENSSERASGGFLPGKTGDNTSDPHP
jgi:hypothetical protein